MYIINITDAKAKFSEVINQAALGEEIIISRMGKPVARILSYEPTMTKPRIGFMKGQAVIPDDFDAWPDEEAKSLGIID